MSTKTRFNTTTCPKCSQTLPGWAQKCQFCGTQIAPTGYARAVDPNRKVNNLPSWKEAAYIVIGVLIVLEGILYLLKGFGVFGSDSNFGGGTFYGIIGAVHTALGIGMLFYQTWAQFLLKWGCVVACFGSGLQLLISLMMISSPHGGILPFIISLVSFSLYAFTIYILNSEGDL